MNYDEIIDCPKSGGDLCYKMEISKDITNYLSLSCGFWTNTLMTENSEFYNEQISTLPELHKDLAWKDPNTNLIWIPNTINLPEKGMIFAHGSNIEEWSWAAVKAIPVLEEEKEKYNNNEYKTDMSTIKHFTERNYLDALSYIGVIPE
jgi:hypothetical protein|tara:strand:+ start:796 stop:1239 length:444 start_codon:yes stop_codon:yes gene_type:complete